MNMIHRKIPPGLKDYALHLGAMRVKANAGRYAGRPDKKREGSRNSNLFGEVSNALYTEAVGILGELVMRHYADTAEAVTSITTSSVLKRQPGDDSDMTVVADGREVAVSVKATEGYTMRANVAAVNRDGTGHIAFVCFLGTESYVVAWRPHARVLQWEVRDGEGGSKYYAETIHRSQVMSESDEATEPPV